MTNSRSYPPAPPYLFISDTPRSACRRYIQERSHVDEDSRPVVTCSCSQCLSLLKNPSVVLPPAFRRIIGLEDRHDKMADQALAAQLRKPSTTELGANRRKSTNSVTSISKALDRFKELEREKEKEINSTIILEVKRFLWLLLTLRKCQEPMPANIAIPETLFLNRGTCDYLVWMDNDRVVHRERNLRRSLRLVPVLQNLLRLERMRKQKEEGMFILCRYLDGACVFSSKGSVKQALQEKKINRTRWADVAIVQTQPWRRDEDSTKRQTEHYLHLFHLDGTRLMLKQHRPEIENRLRAASTAIVERIYQVSRRKILSAEFDFEYDPEEDVMWLSYARKIKFYARKSSMLHTLRSQKSLGFSGNRDAGIHDEEDTEEEGGTEERGERGEHLGSDFEFCYFDEEEVHDDILSRDSNIQKNAKKYREDVQREKERYEREMSIYLEELELLKQSGDLQMTQLNQQKLGLAMEPPKPPKHIPKPQAVARVQDMAQKMHSFYETHVKDCSESLATLLTMKNLRLDDV